MYRYGGVCMRLQVDLALPQHLFLFLRRLLLHLDVRHLSARVRVKIRVRVRVKVRVRVRVKT